MTVDCTVPIGSGQTTTATRYAATDQARDLLVLAHGAGAGHRHPFMVSVASRLASRGVHVLTFNFAYTERERRVPDRAEALESCFRAVVDFARERTREVPLRLFVGGKSMGGRIATHLAAEGVDGLAGIVVLGYPLHPPGKPDRLRIDHLPRVAVPLLVVQGERDVFGTSVELAPVIARMPGPVTLHVVEGGDHSLTVRGTPRDEGLDGVADVVAGWIRESAAPGRSNGPAPEAPSRPG